MKKVTYIGSKLFEGSLPYIPTTGLTLQDCVDMFKIGWRSLEGSHLHHQHWASNEELETKAYEHLKTLLDAKVNAIVLQNEVSDESR